MNALHAPSPTTPSSSSTSPRLRSISQPYDPRSTIGIGLPTNTPNHNHNHINHNAPSRKLPPAPLYLSGGPHYGGPSPYQYPSSQPRGYSDEATNTPRTGSSSISSSSYPYPYTGGSDDDEGNSIRLYTPRTPLSVSASSGAERYSPGLNSPALSVGSSMTGGGGGGGGMRVKSPVKVMFADEPVSRVHTPSSSSSAFGNNRSGLGSSSSTNTSTTSLSSGNKIKGFFGGWKRKTTMGSSGLISSTTNQGESDIASASSSTFSRTSLSFGRFGGQARGEGDRSPVFGSPGPAPEGRFGSPGPFPSPSGSGPAPFHRERETKSESREREVHSMYLPQQTPARSFSSGMYQGRSSIEPIYPRPAPPRSVRSGNEGIVAPTPEFSRQRRRTTSGLTCLDPMGSRSASSPSAANMTTTATTTTPNAINNRKTSVVQRSESSFSVHSESGVETWCESPSYFPSSRSSEDSHEDAIEEDEEEEKARVGVHRGTTFADLAKKRQLVDRNPRISIVLPGSSFNLGLDFGLPGSESTTRGGSTLASLIEDEENASVVAAARSSLTGVQEQTQLDARVVKTGLNPTTPVFTTGWDESVRPTTSAGRTVTRSSTRSSRRSAGRSRTSPPALTRSPAETVRGNSSPDMATPRVTVANSTAGSSKISMPNAETSSHTPQFGSQMPPIVSLNSPAEFPSNPTVLKKRSSTRRSSSGSSSQIQRSQSIMLDSPTLPVSPYHKVETVKKVNNEAFEDPVAERPVPRSSLLRDGRNTHSAAEREVLAQGPTNLRRHPTRRRMKSSGSIASLMSITFGTDGGEDKTGDDLPMFRVIPATPVGNTDAFEARPSSTDEQELASAYKATPRKLDHAAELESTPMVRDSSMPGLADSALPPLPEVRPLNIRAAPHKLAGRSVSSEGRLEQTASVSTSPQFPSLTSMTTASSNTSLATFEDHDQALQQLLAEFSELHESQTAGAYGDHADPLQQIKAELDEEIRSWSSMSLESHVGSPDAEALGTAMHGLGFGIQDDRSPTPIGRIQPLRSKSDRPEVAEEETTPRPDRYSNGFPETRLWQDRRISEMSSESTNSAVSSFGSSDSMTDTDLDSIMSDIEDLQSASIAIVASKTSAKYASPRQVEMFERFYQDEAREEVVVEEDDSTGRWDNAEEDEFEIGWAM